MANRFVMMVCAALLTACGFMSQAANAQQDPCRRTEQKGCLEIDILNLRAPGGFDALAQKPHGPTMYQQYIEGKLEAAAPRSYVIAVWNVTGVPATAMAEYRLPQGYREHVRANRGKNLTTMLSPIAVTEINAASVPSFQASYNIGRPQRAFRIMAPQAGVALQFPRGLLTANSYLLICPEQADGQAVYPDRITRQDGFWVTPKDLNARGDYIVVPTLFKS